MVRQTGFFDVEERLHELLANCGDIERIAALVDSALFRPELERAVPRADGTKGGQPAFDVQHPLVRAMRGLSNERCDYLIKGRLSCMHFPGLGLADPVPDANTIWAFREALKWAGAVELLFAQFDVALRAAGYIGDRRPDRGCGHGRRPQCSATPRLNGQPSRRGRSLKAGRRSP
jgi:IS5 family transposase